MTRTTWAGRGRAPAAPAVLGLLSLLSLLMTWPLARHLTTHVSGDGIDDPALAWNLWWIKSRLVDQLNPDIFHCGWMFHPIQVNLAFYTLTPLNGLLSIPLQTAASLILAVNGVLLASFVLGGYGAYLLFLEVWGRYARPRGAVLVAAALLAGIVYAFASSKLFYAALGQYNIASSQWIPFCIVYLWRLGQSATLRSGLRNGLLAGLFLSFQAWAELTYASFLLIFIALFAVAWLFPSWKLRASRKVIPASLAGLLALGLVFLLGIAPFLAAMLPDLRQEGDFFASGGGFADVFSADLMGFWLPTRLHPLVGGWAAGLPFPNDKGQQIYLGYSALALALVGSVAAWRGGGPARRTLLFWLAGFALFFWLSLGPWLRWAGHDLPVPGLFGLVSRIPFFSGNRYPSRYSVLLVLCLALLASRGMLWLGQRPTRRRGAAVLAAAVTALYLAEHLAVPLPLSDFRVPGIYSRLAAEPGDFAVLELPTGWRNGARVLGRADTLIMLQQWYQTAHGKRRLGGNTSRNPAYQFQYFSETPLMGDLIALMNADRDHLAPVLAEDYPDLVARAQAQATALFAFLQIRYVTLHVERAPALLVRFVEEALPVELVDEWRGPDWTGAASTIRLYRVLPSGPAAPAIYDLGDPAYRHLLGEGWAALSAADGPRWAERTTPTLLLDLPESGAAITLTLAAPAAVRYTLNGMALPAVVDGAQQRLAVPPGLAAAPVDRLQLEFLDPPRPVTAAAAALAPEGSLIGASGVTLAPGVVLVVRSAGEEVGSFAQIAVNGVDHAANRRGYNLVALTPAGEVLAAEVFDTFAAGEAARLAAWVAGWSPGTVVAGAVADEASLSLTEDAAAALQTLGVAGDLAGRFRWSHAWIGVAGSPPGAAVEELALIRPAGVYAGLPVAATTVAGGVRTVEVAPADMAP